MKWFLLVALPCSMLWGQSGQAEHRAAARKPRPAFSVVEATIPAMQAAMKQGRITSRELVRQYLARIATYEDKLHAALTVNPHAIEEAEALDRERATRPHPRTAARHSDRAQGQHPNHQHADHGRRARLRLICAALRSDAHEKSARGRRDHHRQDRHDRACQLGGGRAHAHARQLQRDRRIRHESLRSAPRSAPGHLRRTPRASNRRVELRHRHRGEFLGGQRRHRNFRLHSQPVESDHAGRHQADGRAHQPLRRDSHHRRSGHARADGEDRRRRRHHARRAGKPCARSERSGHAEMRATAQTRLHTLPQPQWFERRAHRHSARVLLRRHRYARRPRPGPTTAAWPMPLLF